MILQRLSKLQQVRVFEKTARLWPFNGDKSSQGNLLQSINEPVAPSYEFVAVISFEANIVESFMRLILLMRLDANTVG